MKSILKKVGLMFFGLVLGLLVAEGLLRIYNPLPTRIAGGSYKLLSNYERTITIDPKYERLGLDRTVHYSTNSLGFRGSEPPDAFEDHFTIFTVGGSTTESSILDDEQTWSYQLEQILESRIKNIWINNAGTDGASTFGHKLMLEEHIYHRRPDMVIFLVGINDMMKALSNADHFLNTLREYRFREMAQRSELFSFLWISFRSFKARKINLAHGTSRELAPLSREEYMKQAEIHAEGRRRYQERLNEIVRDCLDRGIDPVLVTQPIYNLATMHPFSFVEEYNEVTRQVALENEVKMVDLAITLENNEKFYYDAMHYTKYGSLRVAEILARAILPE